MAKDSGGISRGSGEYRGIPGGFGECGHHQGFEVWGHLQVTGGIDC